MQAQSGIIKKLVQKETKTSGVKVTAFVPKVTGKVRKTFMTDLMTTRGVSKTTARIVSRKPLKETILTQRKPRTGRSSKKQKEE